MNSSQIKHEGWLYWLAFLIAIALRFIALSAASLTDSEATLALQALAIARGEATLLNPQPAYILATSVLFAITESTNFLARFLPALAGSALVFAPWFFREKIKPRPALILAFLFAFDPGLVALSRQANGTILTVIFLLFAWAMWNHKHPIHAGIFAGLALLSGPSLWAGLLSLGLTWLFVQGMKSRTADDKPQTTDQSPVSQSPILQSSIIARHPPGTNYHLLASFLSTLLLCGTLFFLAPNGLSAALASLPAYFIGWVTPTVTTPARILITYIAYEPLGIFLTVFAILRAVRTNGKRAIRLMLWLAVSLLLAVFYRQPAELVWAVIPLLTLAALEFSRAFDIQREERIEVGVVVVAISILLVYTWFNISSIALNPFDQFGGTLPLFGEVKNARTVVLAGSLVIVVVCIALVALGWSARIARLGATLSFTTFLGLYAVAAAWGASGLRNPRGVELWTADPGIAQADFLLASVEDLSKFSLGHSQSQPVTVVGIVSPALEWNLRDHSVEAVSVLDPQLPPPMVVTPLMDELGLPSAYRGQDFVWRQKPQWENIQPQDWLKWFVFRELPRENETIILWARDDLFPDARQGEQP